MSHIIHVWESSKEAIEYAVKHTDKTNGASQDTGYGDWAGGTWSEALEMGLDGWSDARPQVDAILWPVREALAELLSDHPDRFHDMTGFEPDIDRYIAGEIDCMFDEIVTPQLKMGKVFTILINGVFNSGVHADTIFKRGAAITALVEAFQMLGCDLNIWVEVTVKRGWGDNANMWTGLTKVHDAGQNLDINNVMFPIGHPTWLRRISFAQMEGENAATRKMFGFRKHGGYGRASDTPVMTEKINPSFVMNMGSSHRDQDVSDPVGWVLKQLQIQGVYDPPEFDGGA